MKTFFDDRRSSAIWNCGMYAGLAFGWMLEPFMRWALVPWLGEPPFPPTLAITVTGLGMSVAAAIIIQRRDEAQARHDRGEQ